MRSRPGARRCRGSECGFLPDIGRSGVYTTTNAGTWSNRGLLDDQASWRTGPLVSRGDPVVMYGPRPDPSAPSGFSYAAGPRVYYLTLVAVRGQDGPEHLAVARSDDNGTTWSAPVLVMTHGLAPDSKDRAWLAVDAEPTSRFFGRLYVSWTMARPPATTGLVMVSISADGGASFAPARSLPGSNIRTPVNGQGSHAVTGPDGSVYVAYEQGTTQRAALSGDGGGTWSQPVIIGNVLDIEDPVPGANFRTNSFPVIAADPRPGSTIVYAAWAQRTPDGGRIVVATSLDRGLSWTPPEEVTTGAEGYAFNPGLAVAPNGRVDVGYHGLQRRDPSTFGTGNAFVNAWYTHKQPDGLWVMKAQVSSAPRDPAATARNDLSRQDFGDYNHVISTVARSWFIFTDSRVGAGCPAVDQHQHGLRAKPAPADECPAQFGNTDVVVARITP